MPVTNDFNRWRRARLYLGIVIAGAAFATVGCAAPAPTVTPVAPFELIEATIPQMQAAMASGQITSKQLTEHYLARIGMYQPLLRAAIYVNHHALEEAEARDRERAGGQVRGPLHGIPIALKDNIHTTNLPTSGGVLAFDRFIPPYEATLTRHLIDAGAVIIAKTALSELAGYTAGAPTAAPGNYTATGGQAFNPYDPRRDPRPDSNDGRPALSPAGSSSGVGTAANLWAANVGTETSGSIQGPSNVSMLVGIKPTVGRISRWGVIPITTDQDTAGPMARTVRDAAILLGVLEGKAPDPNDPATKRCSPPPNHDYTAFLKEDALKGARIGIPRAFYYEKVSLDGDKEPRGGLNPGQMKLMDEAIAVLKQQGAVIVDPANIPSVTITDPAKSLVGWNFCGDASEVRGKDQRCTIVVKYGMKRDFNKWLATLGPTAPVKTLTELRQWNLAHQKAGAIKYGQSRLDISDEVDLERDRPRYLADQKKDIGLAGADGIDAALKLHQLDALFFPGSSNAGIVARPGYPGITVPFGMVPNEPTPPFPQGFDAKPSPYGVSFAASACSEPKLIALAYAFEQATHRRVPPAATP